VTLSAALTAGVLLDQSASAGLPSALVQPTLKAAVLVASGQAVVRVAGPSVAALVDAGIKAMAATKAKIAVALLLAMSLVSGVGLAVSFRPEEQDRPTEAQPRSDGQIAATDIYDDPLPPGAVVRLG